MATGNFEVCPRISPKFGDEDGDSNFGEIPHPNTYRTRAMANRGYNYFFQKELSGYYSKAVINRMRSSLLISFFFAFMLYHVKTFISS